MLLGGKEGKSLHFSEIHFSYYWTSTSSGMGRGFSRKIKGVCGHGKRHT